MELGRVEAAYLRNETLFLLRSKEEANHAEELQVDCGHLDLPQGSIEEVYGQVESLLLEMHHFLAGNKQGTQHLKTSEKNMVLSQAKFKRNSSTLKYGYLLSAILL